MKRLLPILVLCLAASGLPARADVAVLVEETLHAGQWATYRVSTPPDSFVMGWRDFKAGSSISGGGIMLYRGGGSPVGGCFVAGDQETRIRSGSEEIHRSPGLPGAVDGCGVASEDGSEAFTFIAFVAGDGASMIVTITGPDTSRLVARRTGVGAFVLGTPDFEVDRGVEAGAAAGRWHAGAFAYATAKASVSVGPGFFGALLFNGSSGTLRSSGPDGDRVGSQRIIYADSPGGTYAFSGENLLCARADTEGSTIRRCALAAIGATVSLP